MGEARATVSSTCLLSEDGGPESPTCGMYGLDLAERTLRMSVQVFIGGEEWVMVSEEAALYRYKAAEMRKQAERADSDRLRASYFTVASEWQCMAEEFEQAANPMPPPKQRDGQSAQF